MPHCTSDRFLNNRERFPLLTEGGRSMLRYLQEHPHAPKYNFVCGDRLTKADIEAIAAYEKSLQNRQPPRNPLKTSPWLSEFAEFCYQQVPLYRRRAAEPAGDFSDIPTISRKDLARKPWTECWPFIQVGCPVFDVYSLHKAGFVGVKHEQHYRLQSPDSLTEMGEDELSDVLHPLLDPSTSFLALAGTIIALSALRPG